MFVPSLFSWQQGIQGFRDSLSLSPWWCWSLFPHSSKLSCRVLGKAPALSIPAARKGVVCTTHLLELPSRGQAWEGTSLHFHGIISPTELPYSQANPEGRVCWEQVLPQTAWARASFREQPLCKPITPNQTQSSSDSKGVTLIMFILLN